MGQQALIGGKVSLAHLLQLANYNKSFEVEFHAWGKAICVVLMQDQNFIMCYDEQVHGAIINFCFCYYFVIR